jgi:peptide/nickel transport system substrate-binding protein
MNARLNVVFVVMLVISLLISCAPAVATVAPTKPAAPAQPAATAAAPAAATKAPAAAATAAPAAAATKPAAPAAAIKKGGTITAAIQNDWMGMDPLYANVDSPVFAGVMEGLVHLRPDAKGNWVEVAGLAESWTQQDKTVTFKLRKGVKFHDGTVWDAKAAKWNLDRMIKEPKSRATDFKDAVASVDQVDDATVKLNLNYPFAPLLALLDETGQSGLMVSPTTVEKGGVEAHMRNPVGTGPFSFVEWKDGDRVTHKKNPDYWMKSVDGQQIPYLDQVVYRWISDDSVRLLELKAGNIHFTELVQGKDVPGIKSNPDLVYTEGPWCGNQYRVLFGATGGQFSKNYKLRQAALYAIDRIAAANTLGLGAGAPGRYMVLPGMLGYDETIPSYQLDAAKAKQLVTDAGFPNGLNITMNLMSREVDERQAQMLKQMWDAVGLRTTLEKEDRATWTSRFVTGDGNISVGSMRNPSSPDPFLNVSSFWTSKGSYNPAHFGDPEMDKCLQESISTYDSTERAARFKKCLVLDFEKFSYYSTVWVQVWNWVNRKELKGATPFYTTRIWNFREAWLDK